MLALLGPDGCGKTTIGAELETRLRNQYPSICRHYFRPGCLPPPGVLFGLRKEVQTGVNPNPHGHEPESPAKSILRFLFYLLDFTLGYLLEVRPSLRRGALVIFDRYYYDFTVDRFRYNMSLPNWFIRLFEPLVPRPDLTIYLHASPDQLYKRKQELSFTEITKQVEAYEKLVKKLRGAYRIDAERPVEKVAGQIIDLLHMTSN